MTRNHRGVTLFGVVTLFAALLASGCAKPPTEEINQAQAVIDSVKALEIVQQYGMAEVRAAEGSLARVNQMVTDKLYDEARLALPGIFSTARGAVPAATDAKEQARMAAGSAIDGALAAITVAEEKIPQAPRWGKGAIRDLSVLKADVEAAKADVTAAEEAQSIQDYSTASSKARAATTKAQAVTQTVDDAIELRASARRR